jgi:hypothetical protein
MREIDQWCRKRPREKWVRFRIGDAVATMVDSGKDLRVAKAEETWFILVDCDAERIYNCGAETGEAGQVAFKRWR